MITGYNTDIRHNQLVLHVQTEDKGRDNPFIESLVYVGGQVLASKRVGYAQLLEEGSSERDIVEMMDRQHRTVIAAIRQGKFDTKCEALLGSGALSATSADTSATAVGTVREMKAASGPATAELPTDGLPLGGGEGEQTLDQVILEYLTSEADQEQLVLTVEGDRELSLGDQVELALRSTSSKSGQPVEGARVKVRMISTITDPQILAVGETDDRGTLRLGFAIPPIDRGTAALIITATSPLGQVEIKHLL